MGSFSNKRKLKIARFFASLPFPKCLCNKTKAINTLRSIIEKNNTDSAGVLNFRVS